jgi:alpha-amylase
VNPVNEHIQGGQWWTDYQVTSYKLQSKRGSKEQYKMMVDACHAAGVKVIAGVFLHRGDPTPSFMTEIDRISSLGRCRLQPHGWPGQWRWHCGVQYVLISAESSLLDHDDCRPGFSHYDYPGIYQYQDFHHCGTPGDDTQDWGNRWQVQNCELSNLAEYVPSLLKVTYVVTSPLFFLVVWQPRANTSVERSPLTLTKF